MNTTTRRILSGVAAAAFLSLSAALPAAAWPDPGALGSGDSSTPTSDTGPQTVIREVLVDDNAPEYLQIGLGALAGMAAAGAAGATVWRRQHHAPHPA